VKLEVLSYYTPEVQMACQKTGELPAGPSGSGTMRIKWSFLD
jgi:hypothetical protein